MAMSRFVTWQTVVEYDLFDDSQRRCDDAPVTQIMRKEWITGYFA